MSESHTGLPVSGYRDQPTSNVDLVNANKTLEEQCLPALDELAKSPDVDKRWLAVNRSIFKPDRVTLPGDRT